MIRIPLAVAAALVLFSATWVAAPAPAFAACSQFDEGGNCVDTSSPTTSEPNEGGGSTGGGGSSSSSEPNESGITG